jgi:hypothetical protein
MEDRNLLLAQKKKKNEKNMSRGRSMNTGMNFLAIKTSWMLVHCYDPYFFSQYSNTIDVKIHVC